MQAILTPLWATKTETATRVRQRVEAVIDYAFVVEGIDRRNPARWKGNLDKIFPAPRKVAGKVKHHAAPPWAEVPGIMAKLREKDSTSAAVLRFGTDALAGYGVAARLEYLLVPVLFGLGSAVLMMIGACVGADDIGRARSVALVGTSIGATFAGTVGLVVLVAPQLWLSLFTRDAGAIAAGSIYPRSMGR